MPLPHVLTAKANPVPLQLTDLTLGRPHQAARLARRGDTASGAAWLRGGVAASALALRLPLVTVDHERTGTCIATLSS